MTDTVSRNAQRRKAETEQAARAARGAKGRGAKGGGGGGGWSDAGGVYQDGNPLRGRIPKGWEFDDSKEAAFKEQRLNSQVLGSVCILHQSAFLSTLIHILSH